MGVGGFSKVVATFNHVGGSFNLFMATREDVWIIPSCLILAGWGLGAFLRWWPPSTPRGWAGCVCVGGIRSENRWGCAAGRWKLDPKRSREKSNLGSKRLNSVRIGSFNTPKDHLGVGGWEKVPQKDRVQSPECQKKRGSKRLHIHITQHKGSTVPGLQPCGWAL